MGKIEDGFGGLEAFFNKGRVSKAFRGQGCNLFLFRWRVPRFGNHEAEG